MEDGSVSGQLEINDSIHHVSGRTSVGDKYYYKGVGAEYKGHASLSPAESETIIGDNPVFYYGYDVVNPNWEGKFGIFCNKYQPFFSDFIGSCGPKEHNIFKMSNFSRSALSVKDYVEFDSVNKQGYYILEYRSKRDSILDGGNLRGLADLMAALLDEGLNLPWDKTSIRDINSEGFVTDVADMFFSKNIEHRFGTIYSILYSLYVLNLGLYVEFIKSMGIVYSGLGDIPFVCMLLLNSRGMDVPNKSIFKVKGDLYVHLIGNVLLRGRNCASVEHIDLGNDVMIQYLDRFSQSLPENKRGFLQVW